MTTQGEKLIECCKVHLISALRILPECTPTGPGLLCYGDVPTAGLFSLGLPSQDGWFTWSLLMSLGAGQENRLHHPRQETRRSVFSIEISVPLSAPVDGIRWPRS
jgi:hypothetical protein